MGKHLVASNTRGKDQSRAGKGQKIRGSVGLVSYYPCSFSWNRHNSFTMDCDSTYCRNELMELTEDAASTLKHYMEKESPVPEYVRFGVKAGGCSGFTYTIGSSNNYNYGLNAETYVGWNWKAGGAAVTNDDGDIDSEVSVNTTAGFSIVGYTGTGSATTVGHGLSQTPELILIKNRPDADDWIVYTETVGNTAGLLLSFYNAPDTDSGYFNDTSPTSSVFTVGTQNRTNGSTNAMIAYCFHSIEGYSKIGSYTGTGGADGAFVYTGFRPAYVLQKVYSTTSNWLVFDNKRASYNVVNKYLTVDTAGAESEETVMDFTSNGFKFRATSASFNASQDYIYWAFAETPFKTANAR